jgi:KipI family sensor histidine kinase inhibitor
VKLVPASDSSLLVAFGEVITPEASSRVLALFHALRARGDARIRNVHPGYVSVLVDFDPLLITHDEIAAVVESSARTSSEPQVGNDVEIPVCYGGEFGPDLDDVSAHTGRSVDEVIRLHAGATYDVCFLGFTAGFAYLGGMPQALQAPRLPTPRRAVAAGSVGIAGAQTGIYPVETPGGWRLIGRTPLRMFDSTAGQPTRVMPGDRVRFVPIDRDEFERLCLEPR